jgi:hypothetical protein
MSTVDRARDLYDSAHEYDLPSTSAERLVLLVAQTQALATIALADEQRTANLIAYLGSAASADQPRSSRSWISREIENRLGVHQLGDQYR